MDYCLGEVGNIVVVGWAFDPDASSASIDVHVYIYSDEACKNEYKVVNLGPADVSRPDVNAAHTITGNHGFRAAIPVEAGPYYVKVFAIDATGDDNTLLKNPYTDVGVMENAGDGTAENPFVISNDSEWSMFADLTTDPATAFYYSTCSYKLAADIGTAGAPVIAMFGTADNPFSGTFDGDGHSLCVNIVTEESPAAPFRVVSGATIRQLNVSGTVAVNTDENNNHAGGLVGYCSGGTTTIDACNVATRVEARKYAGGIVAHGGETGLVISNSVFSGTIAGFTKCAGGLVGWCNWLTMTLSNCLMKGDFEPGNGGFYHPIALTNNSGKASADAEAVYYSNAITPTATTNLVPGADGIPVSETFVPGAWTKAVHAADGNDWYAAGTKYEVTFAEDTEDVAHWTVTPESPVCEGSPVTLAYSGKRFVKSVTANMKWYGDLSTLTSDVTVTDGMTLTGKLVANVKVTIAAGATVTLKDATINGVNSDDCPWAGITCEGNATIILSGNNTVKGFHRHYPGLFVPKGKTLTIRGNGSLRASQNGDAAGIGGGNGKDCGNIVIEGGTISANGGNSSAAIGGSGFGDCGNIDITDGVTKVTATKKKASPYTIGPGSDGKCGTITIGGNRTNPISDSPYTYTGNGTSTGEMPAGTPTDAFAYASLSLPPGEADNTWTFTMPDDDVLVTVEYYLQGDVNDDGEVGIGDIVAVTNVMAGLVGDGSPVATLADVNGDGDVGIGDIVAITNIMAGIGVTKTYTVNGVSFTMVKVEGGTFQMGSNDGDSDEKPVHSVTLSSFSIGQTEVTQELWYAVMGQKPTADGSQWESTNYGLGDQYPAYYVSWDDIQAFITKLNQLTGQTFRLPTEAEWEFAARGGNSSKGYTYAGSDDLGNVAWYWENIPSQSWETAGYGTQPVATKQANELGLYDMSGNVSEWCQDWYDSGYYSSSPANNPTGPDSGSYRVYRGGCWNYDAANCRIAFRNYHTPTTRSFNIGFRLAQ